MLASGLRWLFNIPGYIKVGYYRFELTSLILFWPSTID
jgi:hypothetical protein